VAFVIACVQASLALDVPIVFTQVLVRSKVPAHEKKGEDLCQDRWLGFEGARIAVLSTNGGVRVLTTDFHSACDPDVSFDGEKLLFAGKKTADSTWRIWELSLTNGQTRPVSPENLEAHSPIYVSTLFTLDSPEPWFTTVFVGRERTLNERGTLCGSSLYNVRLDGGEMRRLTFNPNHNLDPMQMWDGRVIYTAERNSLEAGSSHHGAALHAIHIEGADMEMYGGELGAVTQHMPCGTASGLIVFIEPYPGADDGAGALATVEQKRPHVTYRRLAPELKSEQAPEHAWLYPAPFRDSIVLVSRRAASGGRCAIFTFDTATGQNHVVLEDATRSCLQARVLGPRPRPDGHSTVVNQQMKTGTFYGLNCYDAGSEFGSALRTGAVQRVRFIEGIQRVGTRSGGGEMPVPRRLIGEAPVEQDGSFNVEVPADTPLLLQTVDERGIALATCGWIWVKPKESRGCIGCHEDPERTPENEYVLALQRPSTRLTLPPGQRRTITFTEDIAPLLQRNCATADCHGGKEPPMSLPLKEPGGPGLLQAYETLLSPSEGDKQTSPGDGLRTGRYIDVGRARTSWLVWQLAGTNTARPWDKLPAAASSRRIQQMPPAAHAGRLTPEQFRTLVQWIELGAPFQTARTNISPNAVGQ
jgi:hypothetical protein